MLHSNSSDAVLAVGEQVLKCSSQPAGLSFSQYREHISCERTVYPNLLSPLLSRGYLVTKIEGFASKNKCSFSLHLPLGRLSMAAFGVALAFLAEAFVHFTLLRVALGTVISLGMLAITMVLFFTFFIPKQVLNEEEGKKKPSVHTSKLLARSFFCLFFFSLPSPLSPYFGAECLFCSGLYPLAVPVSSLSGHVRSRCFLEIVISGFGPGLLHSNAAELSHGNLRNKLSSSDSLHGRGSPLHNLPFDLPSRPGTYFGTGMLVVALEEIFFKKGNQNKLSRFFS